MDTENRAPDLGPGERQSLLDLARRTIDASLGGRPLPEPSIDSPALKDVRGAFVTLKIDQRLRGCIGHVIGVVELWRAVRDNALAAAFEDPRFPPLTSEEFANVRIEISALTRLQVSQPEEITVGRDGILVERGVARGLLLPQVAVEYGWDRVTFLDQTCRKAGLEPGCWKHPETIISTFSAEVFGEDEH